MAVSFKENLKNVRAVDKKVVYSGRKVIFTMFLFVLSSFLLLNSCAPAHRAPYPDVSKKGSVPSRVAAYHQDKGKKEVKLVQPKPSVPRGIKGGLKPRFKDLSPLDMQLVSLSFISEDYNSIFQALAHAAGMNLVIDESASKILGNGKRLTAEFIQQPVRDVLNAVCKAAGLAWEEQDGIIFIKGYIERTINLDFIASTRKATVTVGGDVLGGNSGNRGGSSGITSKEDFATPLTGSFTITGETSKGAVDIYKEIEESIKGYLADNGRYFLNRSTGTLLVQGPPPVVERIQAYIGRLKEKYQRQVLIEARIIEVELDKTAELGIDWRQLVINASKNKINPDGTTFRLSSQILDGALMASTMYGVTITNPYFDLTTVVRALEQFGQVHTLSNPRLKVLNGQPAMISVGQSVSYLRKFEIVVDQQDGFRSETPNAEIASIFNGILLGVTPVIDGKGNVTLSIVPIKSDIISMEQRELTAGNLYTFPVVNLREAATTVRARSGDLVILGGLIEDRSEHTRTGLPLLSRLPGPLGAPFKYKQVTTRKVELVIILKIDVINNEQAV